MSIFNYNYIKLDFKRLLIRGIYYFELEKVYNNKKVDKKFTFIDVTLLVIGKK